MWRLAIPAVLLVLVGCRTAEPVSAEELEAHLRAKSQTTVREETFTLGSPYSEAQTALHAEVVRSENALVRRLFAADDAPPVRLYLVPTEADPELLEFEGPSVNGLAGGAFDAGFGFVYVRDSGGTPSIVAAYAGRSTLRHELAHLYARRAGLHRAPWFDEGLALEVESMDEIDGTLEREPFPRALVHARAAYRDGVLDELLEWRRHDGKSSEERAALYIQAHALMRYLTDRAGAGDVLQAAFAVRSLSDDEIRSREHDWESWLRGLDALETIAGGVRHGTAEQRAEYASRLPILAEQGAAELATRQADALALELLDDPACARSAATFLLYFRARALPESDVAALCGSDDPVHGLVGQALRVRRGQPLDLEAARSAWSRLLEEERRSWAVLRGLIPEL